MEVQNIREEGQISDASIVILVWKVIENMRKRGDGQTLDCLLNQQKVLHLSLMTLQKKTLKACPFDITEQVVSFVQRINKITMQSFNQETQDANSNLFIKAIDLLMTQSLGKYVTPLKVLGELKVLTFNNLACIYKRKKKFTLALRSVSFALQIQQVLIRSEPSQSKHNVITTYLNKAAILSEMNRHEKAIEEITKGMKHMSCLEKQNSLRLQQGTSPEEKKAAEQRRHYGRYMKMIVLYNLGVESEHLNMKESASVYYKKSKAIAQSIGNTNMENKLSEILNKLDV